MFFCGVLEGTHVGERREGVGVQRGWGTCVPPTLRIRRLAMILSWLFVKGDGLLREVVCYKVTEYVASQGEIEL